MKKRAIQQPEHEAIKYYVCLQHGGRFFLTDRGARFQCLPDAVKYIRQHYGFFIPPLRVVPVAAFPDPSKVKVCRHSRIQSDAKQLCFNCGICGDEVVSYNQDGSLNAKWLGAA